MQPFKALTGGRALTGRATCSIPKTPRPTCWTSLLMACLVALAMTALPCSRPATAPGVGTAALGRPGSAQAVRDRLLDGDTLRLYVFDGGTSTIADKAMFSAAYDGQGGITILVRSFLVVHRDGLLLWDTGLPDAYVDRDVASSGGAMRATVHRTLLSQLAELGLTPSEIDFLAFSHFHFDHTGNANYFTASTILGQRDEYELAFGAAAHRAFGHLPSTYESIRGNPRRLVDGDIDVFGDGTVQVLRAPGHTIGSQVLVVHLAHSGALVLSGDLWHFESQRRLGLVPAFNFNREQTVRSILRVESLLASTPGARLWITHDPAQMSEVALSPAFHR